LSGARPDPDGGAVAGTISGTGRATPRRRTLRRGLTAAATLLAMAAAAGFAWFDEEATRPVPPVPTVDGIAVLTGGPERVEAGLRMALERPEARVIVSGVGRDADLPALARGAGIEPWGLLGRIALGHEASSTRGNAEEVSRWAAGAGLGSLAVVTAGFHMPRALLELRRAMPGVALHPAPVSPRRARPPAMLREYAKLVGAWLGLSALSSRGERPTGRPDAPAAPAPGSASPTTVTAARGAA